VVEVLWGVYPLSTVGDKCAKGQFLGGIYYKFNKFQYTKIHIIIAVKLVFFLSQNIPKSMSTGASLQTPLGELTAPQTP